MHFHGTFFPAGMRWLSRRRRWLFLVIIIIIIIIIIILHRYPLTDLSNTGKYTTVQINKSTQNELIWICCFLGGNEW